MMDIDALRSLIAFAETGSFTRASVQVHKTQSAISQQMKKLEAQTGKPLFVKIGRDLMLTGDGKLLLSFARQLVSLNDDAMLQLHRKDSVRPLILGVPDDYVQTILPKVLAGIKQVESEMCFDIRCANSRDLRQQLDDGVIDLAILTSNAQRDEGYVLTMSSGLWLYSGDKSHLQQILAKPRLPLILYDQSCLFHNMAVDGLSKLNQPFEIATHTTNSSVITSLVRKGLGVTCMQTVSKEDLVELTSDDVDFSLPLLSEIGISLCLSAHPHPYFGVKQLTEVVDFYKATASYVEGL